MPGGDTLDEDSICYKVKQNFKVFLTYLPCASCMYCTSSVLNSFFIMMPLCSVYPMCTVPVVYFTDFFCDALGHPVCTVPVKMCCVLNKPDVCIQ